MNVGLGIRTIGWSAGALVIAALLVCTPAGAVPGDGICTAGSTEATRQECAILGSWVLETVPGNVGFPVTGTCQVNGGPKSCTFWPYRFSGPSGDNQLSVLIPAAVDIYLNQTYPGTGLTYVGCQQVYAPGVGDPNGFGKGIVTHKVCRAAYNIDVGPGVPNFVLATSVAEAGPESVALKASKVTYFDDIKAPFTDTLGVPRLASTLEQITTASGAILTVETNQAGGLVSATASTGPVTIIPPGIGVLCTPVDPTNTFPNNFPAAYDCGPIVENLDGTNIQAGEHSTCYYRRLDGSLLKYNC